MKIIKKYSNYLIKESDFIEYKSSINGEIIYYDAEWKLPRSPIRRKLEKDLNDILLEIEDEGYRTDISGFVIGSKEMADRRHALRKNFPNSTWQPDRTFIWIKGRSNELVSETIERIKDYLDTEGFRVTKEEIVNKDRPGEQIYIYFDRIEEGLNENKMISIEDCFNEFKSVDFMQDIINKFKLLLLFDKTIL